MKALRKMKKTIQNNGSFAVTLYFGKETVYLLKLTPYLFRDIVNRSKDRVNCCRD